jgi:hypothetical protein
MSSALTKSFLFLQFDLNILPQELAIVDDFRPVLCSAHDSIRQQGANIQITDLGIVRSVYVADEHINIPVVTMFGKLQHFIIS